MERRRAAVILVGCVLLAVGPAQKPLWGQILAMPLSTAQPSTVSLEPPAIGPRGTDWRLQMAVPPPLPPPGSGIAVDSGPAIGSLGQCDWAWELIPSGLIYRPYLAGGRESRLAGQFVYIEHQGWFLDASLGGRFGFLRYGTADPLRPEGWQLDFEGAAFPRLTLEDGSVPVAVDYRYGVPLTFRNGMLEAKVAFYHLSSHLSDGFIQAHPGDLGNGYSRDSLVWGLGLWPTDSVRLYAEAGWAFHTAGPARPWEFQFGVEIAPSGPTGWDGAPFLAINAHLRQDVDYAGGLSVQAGWLWRARNGQLLRTGLQYFNGKSDQMQFLTQHEQQIGIGIWYDF